MKPEPLKGKFRFRSEDKLLEHFCDNIAKCSGEPKTESDNTGCSGQDDWMDKNYSDLIIEESDHEQFASKEDIKSSVEWLEKRRAEEWIRFENGEISLDTVKYNIITHQLKAFEDVK